MQCSRCSYIRFQSSPKCLNCGYDFKKQKSSVLAEAESDFTIFATVGAEAVASNGSAQIEEIFHQETSPPPTDGTELYGVPEDLGEPDPESSQDFELDLSEAEGLDTENWDIGATLAEDLSETPGIDDSMHSANPETGDFEVQGLGFDLNNSFELTENDGVREEEEDNAILEPELNSIADDTTIPEMDPLVEQNKIPFELTETEPTLPVQTENDPLELPDQAEAAPEASLELNDFPALDLEQSLNIELSEISLETELDLADEKLDTDQKPETPVDLKDYEIELNPILELEKLSLDLESDQLEIEPIETQLPNDLIVPDSNLKMDSSENEATNPTPPDEEPTPDR